MGTLKISLAFLIIGKILDSWKRDIMTIETVTNPTQTHNSETPIPDEIAVTNPFTHEREIGLLTLEGVFISEQATAGPFYRRTALAPRVMILGAASVSESCRLGAGTIVNGAELSSVVTGEDCSINQGSSLLGQDPRPQVRLADRVSLGKNTLLTPETSIGNDVVIGDNVRICRSTIHDGAQIETANQRTDIVKSVVETAAYISSDARLESTTVRSGALVESGKTLRQTVVHVKTAAAPVPVLQPKRRGIFARFLRQRPMVAS
jgi:carbonic anhydrase/acetyltransferase-like protein (isoleucine patch superfamily)